MLTVELWVWLLEVRAVVEEVFRSSENSSTAI